MSIVSSIEDSMPDICADNANEVKAEWVLGLEVAIKHKSWKEIKEIKSEMEEYLFSE